MIVSVAMMKLFIVIDNRIVVHMKHGFVAQW